MDTQEIEKKTWDVVVIGTGIGGATIGYALARAGFEVLFCEQGGDYLTNPAAVKGKFPEAVARSEHTDTHDGLLQRAGRWDKRLLDATMDVPSDFRPLLGSGTGGSSALYGMVFERFFPRDFNPKESFPHAHDANLPESWPITYSEFVPYYIAAETLYRVRATHDPLRPVNEESAVLSPPPFSRANEELFDLFEAKGLHPYYLPMACEYKPDCQECLGILCLQRCKNDSASICLEPAVNSFGATLLTHCRADYIDASQTAVHSVVCTWKARKIHVTGRIVVIAAGAIETPALLLRSTSASWPRGLANRSDQVGRNLMRHFLDYYLTYPLHPLTSGDLVKQIAFNDLYFSGDGKLGTLQSNGPLPPAAYVSQGMRDKIQRKFMPFGALFPLARPFIEARYRQLTKGALVFASILEDLPYAENRITVDKDTGRIALRYLISEHDTKRLEAFRQRLRDIFRPMQYRFFPRANLNAMLGHASGTSRFGIDRQTSVLDRDNRAHDLDNLYVVDSSFFPTSSGTNPSLTIAANALRVAEHLRTRL